MHRRVWMGCVLLGLGAALFGAVQVVIAEAAPWSSVSEDGLTVYCGKFVRTPVALMAGTGLMLFGFFLRLFGPPHWPRRRNPYLPGPW